MKATVFMNSNDTPARNGGTRPTGASFQTAVVGGMLAVIVVLMLAGCSRGPKTAAVSGLVTFNGETVQDGYIYMVPIEPGKAQDAGPVVNGRFSFKTLPGQKLVRIEAAREIPGRMAPNAVGEMEPVKEQYIPAEFNERSELTAELKAGINSVDFKLTGDASKSPNPVPEPKR